MGHAFSHRALAALVVASLVGGVASQASAQVVEYGPSEYFQFSDSPFSGLNNMTLEDFEDGLLNVPGVTASTGSIVNPGAITDSVDGDDGVLDGSGTGGHSWFGSGTAGFSFTFDNPVTHAGIVWTDGLTVNKINFQAFDALDQMIAEIVLDNHGGGGFAGDTTEDRFFGVSSPDGIKRIFINNVQPSQGGASGGGIEVDHLQFGTPDDDRPDIEIPEPTSAMLLGLGGIALLRRRRR